MHLRLWRYLRTYAVFLTSSLQQGTDIAQFLLPKSLEGNRVENPGVASQEARDRFLKVDLFVHNDISSSAFRVHTLHILPDNRSVGLRATCLYDDFMQIHERFGSQFIFLPFRRALDLNLQSHGALRLMPLS
jgi:hypothetical protein